MRAAVSRQGFTCGLRLSAAGMLPHESPDRFFSFVATRWAARAPFEEKCSEGVEQYKFRARVIARQRNSQKMSL